MQTHQHLAKRDKKKAKAISLLQRRCLACIISEEVCHDVADMTAASLADRGYIFPDFQMLDGDLYARVTPEGRVRMSLRRGRPHKTVTAPNKDQLELEHEEKP